MHVPARLLVAGLALVLAACSGGTDTADPADEPTPSAAPSSEASTPAEEPAPSATATASEDEAASSDGTCDREATTFEVVATNFAFDVERLDDVCSGDTVRLTVEEGGHSFTAPSEASGDTGVFNEGSETTVVSAPTPGTYTYRCTLHPQMQVEVEIVG